MDQASDSVDHLLAQVIEWARREDEISEVILVGSHATGRVKPNSDIDIVVLCRDPKVYLSKPNWVEGFGSVKNKVVEDWGKVTSLRVWYSNGLEIEFSLAKPDWIEKPIDEGTRAVLNNGFKLLFERTERPNGLADIL